MINEKELRYKQILPSPPSIKIVTISEFKNHPKLEFKKRPSQFNKSKRQNSLKKKEIKKRTNEFNNVCEAGGLHNIII